MKRSVKIILGVLVLLVAVRIALPYVGIWYINKTLKSGVGGYTGSIADLDIHLITGSYTIQELLLVKKDSKNLPPLLNLPKIDFRIFWRPILKGHLRGKVSLYNGRINFVHNDKTGEKQTGADAEGLLPTADKLFPLTIEGVSLHNMALVFHNANIGGQKEFSINSIDGAVNNLTNAEEKTDALASNVRLRGKIMESGTVNLDSKFDIQHSPTAFDVNLTARLPKVTELNPILKHYTGLDVNSGKFNLVIETAGTDKCLAGYVKPVFDNLDIFDVTEKFDGLMNFVGEALAGTVNGIVRNYRKDRTATQVTFAVDRGKFELGSWGAVIGLFKNAFVEAINPANEEEIKKRYRSSKECESRPS